MTKPDRKLADLSPEQRRLVQRWLRTQSPSEKESVAAAIPRRDPAEFCPLSFAQQPLWFVQQWDPGSAVYNSPIAVRLAGPCDAATLARCLAAIVQRHEALRTMFVAVDGQPQQVVAPARRLPMRQLDLEQLPPDIQATLVERLARAEAGRPFDLARGPLLRAQILRLAADEHVLLLTVHHIVFDDWSQGILLRELIALYPALREGRAARLPDLPIQYADYASWQRRRASEGAADAELAFWAERLRAAPPLLDLPTDYARPPIRSSRGGGHAFAVPPPVVERISALSQQSGATLFMALLAAFAVLLARYSDQDDLVIGTPIAGRTSSELEGLIGLFVNVLALRIDLSGAPSFRELLARVRATALAAYAHQHVAFEQTLDALAIERDPSRHPLFQVTLTLQNAPMPALAGAGLRVDPLEIERTTTHYDLGLVFRESGGGLRGRAEYSADLFAAATVRRMCAQFLTLLDGVLADPDCAIAALPLLSAAERDQLLSEWNATSAPYRADLTLPELVQAQAERTPDAVAVVFGEQHLSYAGLARRANQLAHHLRALGSGPETRVGVHLERSVELVIALLGVLKAGSAYIPLDPAYPAARLRFMFEDSGARVLIYDLPLAIGDLDRSDAKIQHPTSKIVHLKDDWAVIAQRPATPPALPRMIDHLAYIIYTSGSTGTPKGVLVPHRGLGNVVPYASAAFAVEAHSRVVQAASISFDASVLELFTALTRGACVVMAALDQLGGGVALERFLDRQAISVAIVTPSFLEMLPDGAYPRLRTVVVGAERCTAATLARWATGRRMLNVYAPTEATIFATAWRADERDVALAPPLGRPITNMQFYLLDRRMQPTPPGVVGEIYLGGVGVARGYHGRPDLTAERFLPNPFAQGPGVRGQGSDADPRPPIPDPRLYRTGDLARMRADGQIEFLGRRDDQIKLRGYRIELGEIAALLGQRPEIHEAVVAVRTAGAGDQRLVAYIVPSFEDRRLKLEDSHADAQAGLSAILDPRSPELRAFLAARLPEYMIPTAFVRLDALPRTPTGKIDRRALPAPDLRPDASASIAPRDRLELQLVQLWEDVLNVRPIGVTDPFFALGGHSLLAVRMMARLRELTGVALPIAALFHHPTIAQLAQALRDQAAPTPASTLVGITTAGDARPLFCIHPLGGNVLCYAQLARRLGVDQPVYGLQSPGLERDEAIPADLETMAAEYVATICAFQPDGPYLLCGWSAGGVIAVEVARQLADQGRAVGLLALLDSYAPPADARPMPDDSRLLVWMARQLGVELDHAALRALDAEQQLAYALEQAQRCDAMLPGLGIEQFGRLFAVYKANARALLRYAPRPYAGRITLFKVAEGLGGVDPAPGWAALALGGLAVYDAPGEHYTMLREPHVGALAERLGASLAQAAG